MNRFLLLTITLGVLACGGDATGPKNASLAGTWRFNYTGMSATVQGATFSCTAGPLDFNITQNGSAFSGSQVGSGAISCTAPGQDPLNDVISGETIINGQVSGSGVSFRLGSIAGQHVGTVIGSSMSGTAQWIFSEGSMTLTLSGQFAATKL